MSITGRSGDRRVAAAAECSSQAGTRVCEAFEVRYTDDARQDLRQLFELLRDRAETAEDFDDAQPAINIIDASVQGHPNRTPSLFRKVANNPFLRELIIPVQVAGHVVLYEIEDGARVSILAVHHQSVDAYC